MNALPDERRFVPIQDIAVQNYQSHDQIDKGKKAVWGASTKDYLAYRPDPPSSFFKRLELLGVGLRGQKIMDLGTGTGALALQFGRQGARATGTDVDAQQIVAAQSRAKTEGLDVRFYTAPAEKIQDPDSSFEVVTANQCWSYFKTDEASREIARILVNGGLLVVSHFTYLPRESDIARRSEDLVNKYNPAWTGRNWDGRVPATMSSLGDHLTQVDMFSYDEPIEFSQASWRGRMRALRGMAATLPPAVVEQFDAEHARLLAETGSPEFEIPHRISAHIIKLEKSS